VILNPRLSKFPKCLFLTIFGFAVTLTFELGAQSLISSSLTPTAQYTNTTNSHTWFLRYRVNELLAYDHGNLDRWTDITLETTDSGLSKSNFKDHYGDAATEQCHMDRPPTEWVRWLSGRSKNHWTQCINSSGIQQINYGDILSICCIFQQSTLAYCLTVCRMLTMLMNLHESELLSIKYSAIDNIKWSVRQTITIYNY